VSLPLFLVDALPTTAAYTLAGPEGHHAADVQRLRPGEELLLGDGRGGVARAEVTGVGKGRLEVRVLEVATEPAPAPRLVVAQGLAKGDRGELAVQAMTEVGVDEIVPWSAARSVVRWQGERGERAAEKWRSTAREAAKQARRAWHPTVAPLAGTARLAGRAHLVLHEEAVQPLSTVPLPAGDEVVLVVGPEGGIAPEELATFEKAGAVPVRLGGSVLRTSTAGVAALAVLSTRLGRW
jgi:16S rRNA (uracil1498-N3)-methyltransferase